MKTKRFDRGPAFSLSDQGDKWWTILRGDEECYDLEKSKFNRAAALAHVKEMNQHRPTFEMKQIDHIPFKVEWAGGGPICHAHCLAKEAWGDQAELENGGLTAFSYLWRRFGPPWHGTDDYKRLACYVLTTPDPDTFLAVDLSASPMRHNVAYIVNEKLIDQLQGSPSEHKRWEDRFWKWFLKQNPQFEDDPKDRTKDAQELYSKWRFEPARIREAEKKIGVFPASKYGRISSHDGLWRKGPAVQVRVNESLLVAMKELLRPVGIRDVNINLFGRTDEHIPEAERSIYAGYGVPREAMDELIKPTKT